MSANLKLAERPRHQTLWLEDGNVILATEDVLFKVHRSMLVRLSPFFLSQLGRSELELFEGFPLIKLDLDIANSSDVEALFRHLYHDKPLHSASSFDQTARILRACTRFNFPQVRKLALDRLVQLFPKRPAPFECVGWEHLPEVAQLALDCGVREIFPTLLYAIVTTSDFDVEESSNEQLPAPSRPNQYRDRDVPSHDLRRLCVRLMNRIMDHFAPILFTVPTSSHMECTGVFADQWMDHAIQPALDDSGVYKPLETLKKIQEVDWSSLGLCDTCYAEKNREWEDEAEDIWSRMEEWAEVDIVFAKH